MVKQPSSRGCFVCGRENPVSLKVTWYNDLEARQVRATVTVPAQFSGFPGVVHGGVVAALLDEAAGRAIGLDGDYDRLMVTHKLDVTYSRPTPTNTPLTVVGWVREQGAKSARVAAELRLPAGTIAARCEAVVVRPPPDVAAAWAAEQPYFTVADD